MAHIITFGDALYKKAPCIHPQKLRYYEQNYFMKYANLPIKSYFGGKSGAGTYQTIINQIPPHDTYISGFLGCDAILRRKKPANHNIGFDLDPSIIKTWQSANFPTSNLNLQNLTLYNHSFIDTDVLANVINQNTFIYLDPPYPMNSRKNSRATYNHEMTDKEHQRLLDKVKWLPCPVAISTYPNDLYLSALYNWRKIEFQSNTRNGMATEWLLMNYPEPTQLHDYSYLGDNFKKREKIKNKFSSLTSKIANLSTLERAMLLNHLQAEYL